MDTTQLAQQYIAGRWRSGAGEKLLVDRNPFNGDTVGEFAVATREDVDEAYESAAAAQRAWSGVNAYAQRTVFEEAAAIVQRRAAEITELIIAEVGGTALKAGFEIGLVIDALKEAATLPLRMEGRIYPSAVEDTENFVYRRPVGVVGVISPFNFPFFLTMKGVAPALALGNGVVVKPHEETPMTGGTLLAAIFEEAGLPPGLLNVTVTEIPVIGDHFLEHPIPRVLAFTGSSAVGRHVGEVAARHFKKAILELGGNSAFIVCEDADLDYAVDAAVFSRFTHQGQICMAANRIIVQSSVAAEFKERFLNKVASLTTGDPAAPETIIGPLMNERHVAALEGRVQAAVDAGATPLLRGETDGNVFAPVVLENVSTGDDVARDELFGPVVLLMEFDSDDEAIRIANDTDFGLSGAVHTKDTARGVRIARQIEAGMIHVNDTTIADEPIVPFGGEKQSGIGRLNGHSSIDELTTLQWISVNHGRRQYPY
ncbi:aldehyde dehydrogenase family protein [Nitriliruptor alkaliphilus]|uniref:aldehyde dehydrogenase family protein n=1 Tax=Nitriliruptor alkaliphilus TaxID=427918 RepID=UPI0006987BA0|nr:aldehyde dehydrogenase family protein [Nitriliruptor alkaliphilus]